MIRCSPMSVHLCETASVLANIFIFVSHYLGKNQPHKKKKNTNQIKLHTVKKKKQFQIEYMYIFVGNIFIDLESSAVHR